MSKQSYAVLAHIKLHGYITPLDALEHYGCFRLAARIKELREMGFDIVTQTKKTSEGKRYASYSIRQSRIQSCG